MITAETRAAESSREHAKPTPPRQMPRPRRRGLGWLFLVIVAGIGFAAFRFIPFDLKGKPLTKPAARVVSVATATATTGDMQLYLTGLGTVTAFNTVVVRSRVEGELIKVAFSEGQMVEQGQLLAEIDPRQYEVALAAAKGQLAKDKATLKNAQLDYDRNKSLISSRAISRQEVDAQAALVEQAVGLVQTDQAQVDNAALQLSYCKITAPISGRIGLRMVDQGNMVRANETAGLAVITQLQPIAVVFTVPQDDIARVLGRYNPDSPLVVEAFNRDFTGKLATGELSAIDNQVDSTTGTVRLKAVFKNDDNVLFPNQFVNTRLLVEVKQIATIIPSPAVQRGPDSNFVYVVKEDETVEVRTVIVGPTEGDLTSIETGIRPGEVVVTDGVDKLISGSKVAVRNKSSKSGVEKETKTADASGSE